MVSFLRRLRNRKYVRLYRILAQHFTPIERKTLKELFRGKSNQS